MWTPEGAEPWQYVCTLDTSKMRDEVHMTETYGVDGEILYAGIGYRDHGDSEAGEIYAFSLSEGTCEKLCTLATLYDISPCGNHELLVLGDAMDRYASWYLYDVTTKKMTPMDQITKTGSSKPTSAGKNGWYTVGEKNLYFINRNGTIEDIATVPQSYQPRTISLSEDGGTAFFYSDGNVYRFPLLKEERQLTLAGSLNEYGVLYDSLPDVTAFLAKHPGVQITTTDYPSSFDELATELLTGSNRFDLMIVELSSASAEKLFSKGYYVDLSADESIAAFVQELYPVWQSYCMNGTEIAAIPISARSVWGWMYSREIWEKEHLGEIPTNYHELFECIREWHEQDILSYYRLFEEGKSSYDLLLNGILINFVGTYTRKGEVPNFQDKALMELLKELEELRPILDQHDAMNMTGNSLLFSEGMLTGVVCQLDKYTENYDPMPLSLTEDTEAVESVFLTLAIINPNSDNVDLAKAYLSYLAEHPTGWARCVLLQEKPDGVREAGYENATEEYEQAKPTIAQAIAEAGSRDDLDAVLELEKQWQTIEYNYRERWLVKPRMTDMLYRVMPYMTVLTQEGYGFLTEYGSDAIKMYEDGMIDSRNFLQSLDQRMRMMQEEGK